MFSLYLRITKANSTQLQVFKIHTNKEMNMQENQQKGKAR